MGACLESTPLSDKINIEAPASTAFEDAVRTSSIATLRPPIFVGSNRIEIVSDLNPSKSHSRRRERSSLLNTGLRIVICLQCSGVSENRFLSSPSVALRDVTSSSLIASKGGLLT